MFTGIIEELGTVERVTRGRVSAVIAIRAEHILSDLKIGDSVAVNGVCLTATGLTGHGFTADVMHETLDRSALAGLGPGSRVNLERAMAANGRFGGHIVAGHVDGVGTIAAIEQDDNAIWFTITAPAQVLRYVVEKGSIAIDGPGGAGPVRRLRHPPHRRRHPAGSAPGRRPGESGERYHRKICGAAASSRPGAQNQREQIDHGISVTARILNERESLSHRRRR